MIKNLTGQSKIAQLGNSARISVAMDTQQLKFEPLPGTGADNYVYRLSGPLVLSTMFAIQDILRSSDVTTILDMTGVPYVDSAGLGVLTNAYVSRQKHGQKLLLVGVCERVQTLFKVTRLENLFEVFPTVDSAMQALGSQSSRGAA
jgi:anti-sigma B factor antagonist